MRDKTFEQRKAGDTGKAFAWHLHCLSEKIPYVMVTTRRKYADVHYDSGGLDFETALAYNLSAVIAFADAVLAVYGNKRSKYLVSASSMEFENIEIAKAAQLAEVLYRFVQNTTDYEHRHLRVQANRRTWGGSRPERQTPRQK